MQRSRAFALAGLGGALVGITIGLLAWDTVAGPGGAEEAAMTVGAAESTSTPPAAHWVNARETRLGPAALVPTELELEGRQLLLSYEMANLAPLGGSDRQIAGGGALAAPASFTLRWAGGEVSARVVAPTNRAVRFPLPDGFLYSQIEEIRIDSYWVAAPVRLPIDLPRDGGGWVPIGPGLGARIYQIVEQAENFLVIVELDGSAALLRGLAITGEAREWASSSSSMLGSPRWTLDYRGDDLPDPVPLVVIGIEWIELAAARSVALAELLE